MDYMAYMLIMEQAQPIALSEIFRGLAIGVGSALLVIAFLRWTS